MRLINFSLLLNGRFYSGAIRKTDADWWLEELKKSLLNNFFFGGASDAIFCIPMI